MKKLAVFLCACFSCFCCAVSFSALSANATENITLTGAQTAAIIGNTVDAYYLGVDLVYHPATLTLVDSNRQLTGTDLSQDNPLRELSGHNVCFYSCATPNDIYNDTSTEITSNQSPLWLVSWNIHLSNITYITSAASVLHPLRYWNYPIGNLRTTNYFTAGQYNSSVHPVEAGTSGAANKASFTYISERGSLVGDHYEGSPIDYYIGDSMFSVCDINFTGERYTFFYFVSPTVNSDYIVGENVAPPSPPSDDSGISTGVITGTITENSSGGSDINVTIENDNSGLISGILNGIKNLFIPSDAQLEAFTDDMQTIADEHLGGLSEAVEIIDTTFEGIDEITARESITVDTLRIPLLGSQEFLLGGWTIPLKPSTTGGFAVMYTAIALLADFFAAFAFLKMCRNKLEIILNPNSEVIENGS